MSLHLDKMTPADEQIVTQQLGREPRGVAGVAWRCPCGKPGVVATEPRLPDRTPFPTLYYLTCPRAVAACSALEADGVMATMSERLRQDPELAARYYRAHEAYQADRAQLGRVDEVEGISAGGMPTRVKCVHVLAAHALAAGPGVNPLGDEALAAMGDFWSSPCLGGTAPVAADAGVPDANRPLRVAAVDCGTNTVRLLVVEATEHGFVELDRRLHLTRLGQGVDATGRFAEEALERTLAAVDDFAAVIAQHGVGRVRFVATSAARDAGNRDEFFRGVRDRLGVEAEIISGDEEAALSFRGAVSGTATVCWPALVMDIGGGSTELVMGTHGGDGVRVRAATSLDMGSVRIRERFLISDPPTHVQIGAATRFIDDLLEGAGINTAAAATWIGVGGTATSLSALVQGLPAYDRKKVHGSRISTSEMEALTTRLLSMRVADIASLPSMPPKRADVIAAGALIADRVARRCSLDLSVSESDILDGLVLGMLEQGATASA